MTNKLMIIWCIFCLGVVQTDEQLAWESIQKGESLAWARHVTGQDTEDLTIWDDFKSVATIYSGSTKANGDTRYDDEIWVVVERSGGTYIEQFQALDWGEDPNYCWFVDCGGDEVDIWVGEILGTPTIPAVPEVLGDYPTLRTTDDQDDPGLTHTTAISNVTELQAMENDLSGNYYLTGNINALVTSDWNGGAGFDPIGSSGNEFTGTFDGAGYTISDLYIDRSSSRIGLFGAIDDPGKIANVTLSSVDITATQGFYVGALVGYLDAGVSATDILIQNCHTSGTIVLEGTTFSQTGGLIGFANGDNINERAEIYDCSSSCVISTTTTVVHDVGGLIGKAVDALIQNCYATGNITIPSGVYSSEMGGLIGYISDGVGGTDGSQVTYCYATGNIVGTDTIGGFVGKAAGTGYIRKCYATGDVTGHDESGSPSNSLGGFSGGMTTTKEITDCYAWGNVILGATGNTAGGFTGTCPTNCSITNSYSIGTVTPTDLFFVGGFGGNTNEAMITFSFWDTETSNLETSDGGIGHITIWMKRKSNFTDAGWDMDTIWYQEYTAEVPEVPEVPTIPGYADTVDVGYGRFEGEDLCVYADGRPIGNYTVVGGELDGLDESLYTIIIAGLNYFSIYESFPIVPTKGHYSSINDLKIDFFESMGCHVGVTLNDSVDWVFSYDDFATAIAPVSEIKAAPFVWGQSREPVVYLHEWTPVSLTIRAIHLRANLTVD